LRACKTAVQSPIKLGVRVPKGVKQAFAFDKMLDQRLWQEAIKKELDEINHYETFRVLADDEPTPEGYKQIPYHIVFDVKFDGRHKARLVAGGHMTDPPKDDTFSGVVFMEAV